MTFTVDNKMLCDRLNMLAKVVNAKNTLPILNNFIFKVEGNMLHLTAGDTENRMTTTINITENEGEGDFAVNVKDMLEAVKNLTNEPLTFSKNAEERTVKVEYFKGFFALPTENTEEYPVVSDIETTNAITMDIPENILQETLARTVFAAAQYDLRPVMCGIYFDLKPEHLNIVASDGQQLVRNRLTNIKGEEGNTGAFILPKKTAHILKNSLRKSEEKVTVTADRQHVAIRTDVFTLNCRLIEGYYPNYNRAIPQNNTNILKVDRQSLLAALRRVKPFANDSGDLVKVHIETDTVQLSAEDYSFSKTASENVACNYDGDTFTIGFKGIATIEILDNIKCDEIEIQLSEPSRPALILPTEQQEGQEVLMLMMPMLITD